MGLFDRVWVQCPDCGNRLEFQSKAGECAMFSYEVDEVPVGIASDLDGKSKLCKCGQTVTIRSPYVPKTTRMIVV